MTNKSEELYATVLSALHAYIPDFKPLFALCDFEKASRNSFVTIFPHITLIGRWFHFTKAIYDKVKRLGLGKLYKTNKVFFSMDTSVDGFAIFIRRRNSTYFLRN